MVQEMVSNIRWLGHSGFLIKAKNKIIVIDPYEIGDVDKADILLVTHEHFDHCSIADIAKVQKDDTVIITEPQAAAKLSGDVRVVKPGDSVEVFGIKISAVSAYNTDKDFHPKENAWLGFIIDVDQTRIYHSGDTDLIEEMSDMDVDIALLPVSGIYVMTWEQAVEAVKKIGPKIAIPMHYGAIAGSAEDAEKFKIALDGICEVIVLEK